MMRRPAMARAASVSLLTAAVLAGLPAAASADVRLPRIISDHMVLQQGQKAPIWGWADPGEPVLVAFAGKKVQATADQQGKWMVEVGTPKAGGPYEMTVATGKNKIVVKDILVGEVWLASGQSNMQWSVNRAANPQEEIAAAKYPKIRLFTVGRMVSDKPRDDCNGSWSECNPTSVAGFSAVAYFFGRELHKELEVPVGLINSSWGGTICEAWTSRQGLEGEEDFEPILQRAADFKPNNPNQASALYNGMIHPIVPFAIRGAIWYQGESNAGRAWQYKRLFPAMIRDWRRIWDQGDFPFLFVQLAPFRYGKADPRNLPETWEAQLQTLSLPNTGMAVTTDIGNIKDIHPKNKQDVGKRLALWALANTYGKKDLAYSGPLYDGFAVEGDKIRVKFHHAEGLVAKGGELTHFTIAGEDEKFVPAEAAIDGQTVVVSSPEVKRPVAVRFGWTDTAEPNLFNGAGLPASPFRTDDFKMVTEGNK